MVRTLEDIPQCGISVEELQMKSELPLDDFIQVLIYLYAVKSISYSENTLFRVC